MDEPSEKDKPDGWIDPEDLQKEPGEDTEEIEKHPAWESVEQVAQEVIAGQWGVGQERRTSLSHAGYNVKEVEAAVKKILQNR